MENSLYSIGIFFEKPSEILIYGINLNSCNYLPFYHIIMLIRLILNIKSLFMT